ncbi:unnamed protein product [Rotaria sordida]|uniref:Uncharacterized protein n=2 Tax=Rotaria sordida TaxID=392033 RepID=A0A819X8Q4_9BILA|nr:unnamed protein product [Rotaria sordida]
MPHGIHKVSFFTNRAGRYLSNENSLRYPQDLFIDNVNDNFNQTIMIVGDENRHHHCNVSFFPTAMKLDKFENIFVIINGSS